MAYEMARRVNKSIAIPFLGGTKLKWYINIDVLEVELHPFDTWIGNEGGQRGGE